MKSRHKEGLCNGGGQIELSSIPFSLADFIINYFLWSFYHLTNQWF